MLEVLLRKHNSIIKLLQIIIGNMATEELSDGFDQNQRFNFLKTITAEHPCFVKFSLKIQADNFRLAN